MASRILVATHGRPGSSGALRMARRMEEAHGARVEVLAVYEPMEIRAVGSPDLVEGIPANYIRSSVEALRDRVRAQLQALGEGASRWPIRVEVGRVAPTVARVAVRDGATLILLGLHQPGALDRWLAREMLLRLIHVAHVPVMAVPEDAADLPKEVVLAMDFSDFSVRVARELPDGVAPGARLHLVHVTWAPAEGEGWTDMTEWQKSYHAGVDRRLSDLAAELEKTGEISVEVHVLTGDPRVEILRFAEQVQADLIAAGSHGSGFIGRVLMGSVSSRLVHSARCSLLIGPPREVPAETEVDLSEPEVLADLGTAGELALANPASRPEA